MLHLGNGKEGQEVDFTFRWMHPSTTSPFYWHCCYSCCHKGNLSLHRELKAPHRSQTEAYWEPRSPSQPLSIAATVPQPDAAGKLLRMEVDCSTGKWEIEWDVQF